MLTPTLLATLFFLTKANAGNNTMFCEAGNSSQSAWITLLIFAVAIIVITHYFLKREEKIRNHYDKDANFAVKLISKLIALPMASSTADWSNRTYFIKIINFILLFFNSRVLKHHLNQMPTYNFWGGTSIFPFRFASSSLLPKAPLCGWAVPLAVRSQCILYFLLCLYFLKVKNTYFRLRNNLFLGEGF